MSWMQPERLMLRSEPAAALEAVSCARLLPAADFEGERGGRGPVDTSTSAVSPTSVTCWQPATESVASDLRSAQEGRIFF